MAESEPPFRLSELLAADFVVRDGVFAQTNFCGSRMPHVLCFVMEERYVREANDNPNVAAVITSSRFAAKVRDDVALAVAPDPQHTFYELHNRLVRERGMAPAMAFGVAASARIHESAIVASQCFIGERVEIGPGAIIQPYSHFDEGVHVGPGAIVGADGHFFNRFESVTFRVAHAGGVWVGRGAELLAGSIVSKAVHPDFTVLGEDVTVSVAAHVGHGCRIGKRTILAGNVQVSGYTTLGEEVWVGPGAVIGNLLNIGDRARIETGSVVVDSLRPESRVSGNFAFNHVQHVRRHVSQRPR